MAKFKAEIYQLFIEDIIYVELSGTVSGQASISGNTRLNLKLSSSIEAVAGVTGNLDLCTYVEVGGSINATSEIEDANLTLICGLSGSIDAESDLTGYIRLVETLSGTIAATSLFSGIVRFNWEEPTPSPWNDWTDREGATDEAWILRTDAADNSWTERTDEGDDIWVLRRDAADNSWTNR